MYCVPTIHLGIVRSFLPRWGYISTGAVQGENEGREPFDSRPSAVHFRALRGSGAVGMAAMASARAGVASLPHFTVPSARMRPAHFAAGSPHLPDAMPTVSRFSGFALSESGRVYESVHSTPSASTTTFGNLTACAAARNASTSGASVSDGTGFASSLMRRSIHSACLGVGLPFASAPKRLAANSAFCGLLPMICARADIFCCLSILAYPFCPVGATPQRERGRGKTIRLPSSPNEEGEPLSAPLRGRLPPLGDGGFRGRAFPDLAAEPQATHVGEALPLRLHLAVEARPRATALAGHTRLHLHRVPHAPETRVVLLLHVAASFLPLWG